nr:uncharacterized protein LOC127314861 isoform X4 [Lolium perenne]
MVLSPWLTYRSRWMTFLIRPWTGRRRCRRPDSRSSLRSTRSPVVWRGRSNNGRNWTTCLLVLRTEEVSARSNLSMRSRGEGLASLCHFGRRARWDPTTYLEHLNHTFRSCSINS